MYFHLFSRNKCLIISLIVLVTGAQLKYCDTVAAEEGVFSDLGRIHKYLGYGTLLMATGSVVSGAAAPEHSVHPGFSYAAMGLGISACVTGTIKYWNGPEMEEKNSKRHALLGVVSTLGFIAALALADRGSHKAIGGISEVTYILTPIVVYF